MLDGVNGRQHLEPEKTWGIAGTAVAVPGGMRKIQRLLLVSVAALRMVACAAEQDGTALSGTVNMTRSDGSETGQTGFVFPEDTVLDAGPFTGECKIQRGAEGDTLSLWIQLTEPDAFGLASFGIVSPIEPAVEPGKASVSAEASGATFEDLAGSCAVVFGGYDEYAGSIDLGLDCTGLAVQDGSAWTGTVELSASLSLDGCEVSE